MTDHSRRRFLKEAAIAGASAAVATTVASPSASAESATRPQQRKPTFVLVNGNSNNSFCWTPLVRELGLLGHRSVPVELPGHGLDADFYPEFQAPQDLHAYADKPTKLAPLTLDDFAGAAIDVVRQVAEHGPVVLVGHSLGGATLSKVGNAVPQLISRLIYASAVCCTELATPWACVSAPENSGAGHGSPTPYPTLGDATKTHITRINWRSNDPEFLAGYKADTMAEATDAQFLAALSFVHQPDENAYVSFQDARGNPGTWGRIPRSYIYFTQDRANTLPLQRRMVADADELTPDNRFTTHALAAGHLGGILFKAKELAQVLDRITRH